MLTLTFVALLVVALIVDFSLGHNGLQVRRALWWSAIWILLSLGFGGVVYWLRGGDVAEQFITGYLLEKSLSVDNLFVFLIIFRRFQVPERAQPLVLTWGILGAIVLRMGMIYAGAAALERYHWLIYLFGASLLFTGARTLVLPHEKKDPTQGFLVRQIQRVLPIAPLDGNKFFTRRNGRLVATTLLLTLITVEITDLVFAVDSIPAIFAITSDPFIVLTSNVLALIGLRALFFALAGLLARLRYLRHGLGVLLILVGIKMCLSEVVELPVWMSLAVTCSVLGVTVLLSLAASSPRRAPA